MSYKEINPKDITPEMMNVTESWAKKRRKEYLKEEVYGLEQRKINLLICLAKYPKDEWLLEDEIKEINKQIKSMEYKLYTLTDKFKNNPHKRFSVEEIKQIPIGDIMDRQPKVRSSEREVYLCPFHKENTPSFVVFKEKNNFKCFGCGVYGDVIDVYMKLNNCTFIEACKTLG